MKMQSTYDLFDLVSEIEVQCTDLEAQAAKDGKSKDYPAVTLPTYFGTMSLLLMEFYSHITSNSKDDKKWREIFADKMRNFAPNKDVVEILERKFIKPYNDGYDDDDGYINFLKDSYDDDYFWENTRSRPGSLDSNYDPYYNENRRNQIIDDYRDRRRTDEWYRNPSNPNDFGY